MPEEKKKTRSHKLRAFVFDLGVSYGYGAGVVIAYTEKTARKLLFERTGEISYLGIMSPDTLPQPYVYNLETPGVIAWGYYAE